MNKEHERLSDYKHARIRTEMYFGSRDPVTRTILQYADNWSVSAVEQTWVPAVYVAFREILDNALDELVTRKHGDRIDVFYNEENGEVRIEDNGRGIPFGIEPETGKPWATVLLSETKSGSNFRERGDSRGMNGVGGSITNFCSEWFSVESERDNEWFTQRFREGDELIVDEPTILPSNGKRTGTKISFKFSKEVFPQIILPETFIRSRMYEIALCYRKLKVFYNGSQIIAPRKIEGSLFRDKTPISIPVTVETSTLTLSMIPGFFEDNSEGHHTLVNGIPMFEGGTHVDACRKAFANGMLEALTRESKRRKLSPNRSDIMDGMLLFGACDIEKPNFDGQSKTRLTSEWVGQGVRKVLEKSDVYKDLIKENTQWVETIFARCAERTQKKDLADLAKMAKKAKKERVEDLDDACGGDRSKCVLFLAEGKSAIAGIVAARNPEIHGGLPLRGKVLNVREMSAVEVATNEALGKVMKSIGLTPGMRVNRHSLRYSKVYITCDADEDGKNIIALIINFFHRFWPELLDPSKTPFLYVFDTPLIVAVKGKERKFWFNDNYKEFNSEKHKGWDITRAKGLAALKDEDWPYLLADPKLIPITDDGQLDQTLSLLFEKGKDKADLRKEWIGL